MQLELRYCVPLAIPHSEFASWSESDRAKALAWVIREARRCNECATFPEEWKDERGRDIYPYEVHETRCGGCVEMKRHREDLEERTSDHERDGIKFSFTPAQEEDE